MRCKGFTLIELVFTAAIAITIISFAFPGLRLLIQQNTINTAASQLFSQIHLARTQAIAQGKNVILCATDSGKECGTNWSRGYMVFVDGNNDDKYQATDDQLININKIANKNLSIQWRSFRGNKPIRFLPMGITWHYNGTFTVCLNHLPKAAKSLFMAKSGRVEMSQDKDRDGIDEGRNGKPIICS